MPTTSASYYLFLRLQVSPPLHWEDISIFANGDRLWKGTVGEVARDLCLKIYKKGGPGPWILRLGIWSPAKHELYDAIMSLDSRGPAIGVHRLVVVPEDDLHARMEILQNMLFNR